MRCLSEPKKNKNKKQQPNVPLSCHFIWPGVGSFRFSSFLCFARGSGSGASSPWDFFFCQIIKTSHFNCRNNAMNQRQKVWLCKSILIPLSVPDLLAIESVESKWKGWLFFSMYNWNKCIQFTLKSDDNTKWAWITVRLSHFSRQYRKDCFSP